EDPADRAAGGENGPQVGPPLAVDGRRHGDDEEGAVRKILGPRGELQFRLEKLLARHFPRAVMPAPQLVETFRRNVETVDRLEFSGQGQRHRQPHVTEPDHGDTAFHSYSPEVLPAPSEAAGAPTAPYTETMKKPMPIGAVPCHIEEELIGP